MPLPASSLTRPNWPCKPADRRTHPRCGQLGGNSRRCAGADGAGPGTKAGSSSWNDPCKGRMPIWMIFCNIHCLAVRRTPRRTGLRGRLLPGSHRHGPGRGGYLSAAAAEYAEFAERQARRGGTAQPVMCRSTPIPNFCCPVTRSCRFGSMARLLAGARGRAAAQQPGAGGVALGHQRAGTASPGRPNSELG